MEKSLLHRLTLRRDLLVKKVQSVEAECATGIPVSNIRQYISELKDLLDKLDTENKFYLSTSKEINEELMHDCMQRQINTEKLIATLQEHEITTFTSTKLPKLELPRFDGTQVKFQGFWDKFEANIHLKNLPNSEKFSYLYSCLEGEATKVVEGLTITNDNYNLAIQKLKQRYGIKSQIIDAHYKSLSALPQTQPQAIECRRQLDTIETHLRVLQSLGEDIESNHLRVTIRDKFPDSVLYQVNLQVGKEPTVTQIREALETVISAMEESKIKTQPLEPVGATTEALYINDQVNKIRPDRKRKFSKRENPNFKRTRRELKCTFCSGGHYPDQCTSTLQERKAKLKDRCFRCFQGGHRAKFCKNKRTCFHCRGYHNRALCKKYIEKQTGKDRKGNHRMENEITLNFAGLTPIHRLPFLQTAVVTVNNKKIRLLLDSGSQRSYLSSEKAKVLNIVSDKIDLLSIYTFGSNKPQETQSPSAHITIKTKRGIVRRVEVNIVPSITQRVPITTFRSDATVDILADDDSVGEVVDLLIGNDYYFSFIRTERVQVQENIYLVNSDFGWLISGHISQDDKGKDILSVITYCHCHQPGCPYFTEPDLPLRDIDMKFLWTLESIGITDSPKSTREEEAVKYFNETTKYVNGRYEVKWPWVQYPPELPTNYGLAYGRLKGVLKRLNQETLADYNAILHEQLKAGVIEVVDPKSPQEHQSQPPVHYLPHHMVKQEGKRGRLVYDASAKLKNQKSLNECMYSGPSMLEDLTALLLKFRMGKIGISADVEKAFLQVALQEEDRDVTRFLWVKDPNKDLTDENLIHYRFCRVPFGIIASPFLLTATIRFHIARTNKNLLSDIADRCYVDNLILSVDTEYKALQIYQDTKKIFAEISMNIRDWTSNSCGLIQNIPEPQQAPNKETAKILGLIWNIKTDSLQLNSDKIVDVSSEIVTKRDVLRTLARVFDPCGFVSPAVLHAKLLFQELCVKKLKWDTPLPDDMLQRWKSVLNILAAIKIVEIPRYVGTSMPNLNFKYEVHCFCDASKDGYAAVVYLRLIYEQTIKVVFLMSKARVTPVEDKDDLKIPRLELLAYVIGNRLLTYVRANLDVTFSRQFLWTDSQVVLAWMKSNKLLPPFVQRRVNEIKKNKDVEFRYVGTKINPADIATRPELWQQKQELWFCGPKFLTKVEEDWPTEDQILDDNVLCSSGEGLDTINGPEMTMEDCESDLTDITDNLPTDSEMYNPDSDKLPDQERISHIKRLQSEFFPREVSGEKTSLSRNLDLFMDVDGVLRSKGRLANTTWSYDMKHPILIPKDCDFTMNTIQRIHEENYHVGVSHTLMKLREKYWVPHGRSQVQKALRKCHKCIKNDGGPYKLPTAPNLPEERVTYSSPFTYSGVDYFGPLFVSTPNGKEKRWVCLFTCLAVRAVHMELVKDLTAEECLLALRRFTAARGLPKKFFSDNSTYFKLVSEVLTSPYCKENMIQWKFIPQLAPWHGAFYERLIGIVKQCLKRTLDKHLLTDQQLMTVVKEVETVVNSRPLTCVGAELEHVLRPSDFLSMKNCLIPVPSNERDGTETSTKVDLIGSWRKGIIVLSEFKKMFMSQYLTSLRERYNHSYRQPRVMSSKTPRVGDTVQIKGDSRNRSGWKVGKISSLIRGADGMCRVAKVKIGNTEFTRSLGHLYPLESDVEDPPVESAPNSQSSQSEEQFDSKNLQQTEEKEIDSDKIVVPTIDRSELEGEQPDHSSDRIAQASPRREDDEIAQAEGEEVDVEQRVRRGAAIRAREKIAEWTRQLVVLLASL